MSMDPSRALMAIRHPQGLWLVRGDDRTNRPLEGPHLRPSGRAGAVLDSSS